MLRRFCWLAVASSMLLFVQSASAQFPRVPGNTSIVQTMQRKLGFGNSAGYHACPKPCSQGCDTGASYGASSWEMVPPPEVHAHHAQGWYSGPNYHPMPHPPHSPAPGHEWSAPAGPQAPVNTRPLLPTPRDYPPHGMPMAPHHGPMHYPRPGASAPGVAPAPGPMTPMGTGAPIPDPTTRRPMRDSGFYPY